MWPFNRKAARARDEPSVLGISVARRTRGDQDMTGSEAIYAAVSRISNTVSCIPVHLYREYELQRDHPLERLVSFAPNERMTGYSFRNVMEACRNTSGNAYAIIVPSNGPAPASLDVLDPERVTPYRERDTGDLWYQVMPDVGAGFWVHHSGMIVLRHTCTNGERGIRPLDVLRSTLDYDLSIKEFSVSQLDSVGSGVVLNMPTSMTDPDKRKKFVSEFVETYRASKGRVMVVQGGVTASTMNLPAVDARVLDVERITKNRVATVYNIPPHMLGDYSDTSYSTAEQSMLEFLQLTILPILTQWENELNRKLLTWEMIADGYAFRFDMDALTRPDAATMAEKNQKALRGGWQTINETRAMDGKPPVSGGDTPLIARDLLPLERVLNGETISAGGSAGKGERNNRE